jgi:hypothetical protein
MFRLFQQSPFQPPQHGDGMWPPLAYAIDFLAFFFFGIVMLCLLVVAFEIMPLFVH